MRIALVAVMETPRCWKQSAWWLSVLGLSLGGCGGATPGAQPHDMSVAHHEEMARREGEAARAHDEEHDPNATAFDNRCQHAGRSGAEPICWYSTRNPTAAHLRDADQHRKMAEDHRAAAQALRDAEAKACVGIAEEDRDASPFYHREDILRVEAMPAAVKGAPARVTVVFRGVPGLTVESFQHLVDCHLARNSSLGHSMPEMAYCPLVPKGATAKVTAADGAFSVELGATDPAGAEEVMQRAQALAPH